MMNCGRPSTCSQLLGSTNRVCSNMIGGGFQFGALILLFCLLFAGLAAVEGLPPFLLDGLVDDLIDDVVDGLVDDFMDDLVDKARFDLGVAFTGFLVVVAVDVAEDGFVLGVVCVCIELLFCFFNAGSFLVRVIVSLSLPYASSLSSPLSS